MVDMAVLPVANFSEQSDAHRILLPRVYRQLEKRGVSFVAAEVLRPLLRERRIRSRGWISRSGAQTVAEVTGARYLLIGSWDVLRNDFDTEIGISLRVLDTRTMKLVAAVSTGAAGTDSMGLLGMGRVESLGRLADNVVDEAFASLFPLPDSLSHDREAEGCARVALIPLDSFSETPNAGEIMTNVVIAGLVSAGYDVVEPGFVRELGLDRGVANRGGIDRESARAIRSEFGACRVITGTVERFSTATGPPGISVPSVAFGLRVVAPRTGTLVLMEEFEGTGEDRQWAFQRGRMNSVMTVANDVFHRFIKDLKQGMREEVTYDRERR